MDNDYTDLVPTAERKRTASKSNSRRPQANTVVNQLSELNANVKKEVSAKKLIATPTSTLPTDRAGASAHLSDRTGVYKDLPL